VSLVSSRVSLVHRCVVERDDNAASADEWGTPPPPDWQTHLPDLECRAWVAGRETVTDRGDLAVVLEVHLIVPVGTDVTESDRVASVTYRGDTLYEGPLAVHAVLRRRDHLELVCAKAV